MEEIFGAFFWFCFFGRRKAFVSFLFLVFLILCAQEP